MKFKILNKNKRNNIEKYIYKNVKYSKSIDFK